MAQDLAGLDYPIAVVTNVPTDEAAAAAKFRDEIRKPAYEGIFATAGFRTASGSAAAGFPAAHGALNTTVPVNPLHMTHTPNDPVAGALALWGAANTKSRVLVMLNKGASMGQSSIAPGLSRMQLAQYAATGGVALFTDDSELGSWAFAPGLDGAKDYKQMVPVKALNSPGQVPALNAAMAGATAQTDKPGCSLYPALDAAYKYMLSTYEAGKINTIVVFTDCAAAPAQAKSMQLTDLTTDIGGRASASTPIPVILINVNPKASDINKNLNAIAAVVGGKPLPLTSPEDIVNVFLQAIVALGPGS
jgi:Ca-activated chloride channel homolog